MLPRTRLPGAILLGLLVVAVCARLGSELHKLLLEPDGPIDLLFLRELVKEWFVGLPFYYQRGGMHPPAVFLLLWPVYGWASEVGTRWVFLVAATLALAGLAWLLLREARPASGWDRAWLAVVLIGCYPVAITIGNGQSTFFILLAAFAGVLVSLRRPPGPGRDAVLAALSIVALIKPNLSVPFFWVVAFKPGWMRPAALAIAGYVLATLVSVELHGAPLRELPFMFGAWYDRSDYGMVSSGYGNIHAWLGAVDLMELVLPASLLIFALHGLWAWRHREADTWVLLGVAAIVARMWGYHRVYDDLLLVFPLIALYRLGRGESPDRAAWTLFLAGAAALVAPITPILNHATWLLVGLWLLQLGYLVYRARRTVPAEPGPAWAIAA